VLDEQHQLALTVTRADRVVAVLIQRKHRNPSDHFIIIND
jgi:hypothetical protein